MSGLEAASASGVLKVAGDKLASLLANEFSAITGVKRDLSELRDIHAEITSRLSAACDRGIQSEAESRWVVKLKDMSYDIDDILQEVQLEADKHKMERDDDQGNQDGCFCAIAGCFCAIAGCFYAKLKTFAFRYKMAHKIKAIKVRSAAIVKQRSDVNTLLSDFPRYEHVGTSYSADEKMSWLNEVPESKIPLRDQEKDAIISKLVECNVGENNMIVSIVGLGGSGKTTLAKHICHDANIKGHFGGEIFWVHVSQEFHVQKLIGKLFETIFGEKSDRHPLQHMVQKISEKLRNKKFLLILDDAWHENRHDWEQFMVQLKFGAPETRIMLTTRDLKVAEAVESKHIFHLAFLSEFESWNLFLKGSGLAEQDLSSDHIQVGKEIIKGCGGVPLAIQTLGYVLREKKEISAWRAIRDNDLWNVRSINDRVFASLKLSYIHLLDELKQCFTFCSIFPKGYEIRKDRLIGQWIAHGFINAMNGEQPEDIGRDYLDCLVKVRFLQEANGSWHTDRYIMHDLIHDLTRQILKDELVTFAPIHTTEEFTHRYRYLSLTSFTENVDKGLFNKVRALYISDSKTSFDTTVKNSCMLSSKKKNSCMRSVVLDYAIDTPFPLFILKFENLGYLEIHNVSCTTVPEAISRYWNLQSLHFVNCKGFVTLPASVGKLQKLRALELWSITDLESLPESIGECYVLQSLQLYNCSKLREIPSSLGRTGNLCVLDIEHCSSLQRLPSDNIGEFKNLRTINFNGCTYLQDLPSTLSCPTLRTLNLSRTKVTMLPQWITSIDTLECIDLGGCMELRELPKGIVNLKRLAVLNIERCSELRCLPSGLGQLSRLRKLGLFVVGCGADDARISELENLDMIGGYMEITNLKYLKNPSDAEKACLKRKSNLQHLELNWSLSDTEEELVSDIEHDWGVLNALEPPSQIESLNIYGYRGPCLPGWMTKQQLPSDNIGEFKNLRTINFNGCMGLSYPTLHTLNCFGTEVTMLPQWVTSIDTLECVDLGGCYQLQELPKGITNLKRLSVLNIKGCRALCCLPSGLGQLTRLRKLGLFVVGCGADDARISELENLDMIGGDFEITNLKYLKDPSDAEKACLKRKSNIQCLMLDWSCYFENKWALDMEHDWGVLNALEPPPQIEELRIYGYRGPCLPGWMMKQNESSYCEGGIMLKQTIASQFHCLFMLMLSSLPNLRHMRGFVELPSLKTLVLAEMPNLEEMWTTSSGFETGEKEFAAQCPFPVLSTLDISGCPKLNGSPCFPPSLHYLYLERSNGQLLSTGRFSHQLPSMHALVPQLKILKLREVTGTSHGWELLQHLTKLKELDICRCNDLTQLPESMRNLTSLERLCIDECPAVGTLPDWLGELHSLRDLELWMRDTKQFPEAIQHLTSLETLSLFYGRALTVLPECIGQLSALRQLVINSCPALQYLPQSIQRLTALEELIIVGCPGLAKRYKQGAGPDWHLVSHIPRMIIW